MVADPYKDIHTVLRSGLPLPSERSVPAVVEYSGDAVTSILQNPDIALRGGASFVLDAERQPTALIAKPATIQARHYVMSPSNASRLKVLRPLLSWDRDDWGVVHCVHGPKRALAPLKDSGHASHAGASRLVTVDATVLAVRLHAELFEPGDEVIVPAASQIDILTAVYEARDDQGNTEHGWTPGPHTQSTPLPVNGAVLQAFQILARAWKDGTTERQRGLTTSDLLCAATSLTYNLPLYTTRPGAYRFLKNGLKTIEYGPIRNPDIVDAPSDNRRTTNVNRHDTTDLSTAPPLAVVADPAISAATVISRYQSGAAFTDADRQMIAATTDDLNEYFRLIFAIVGDEDHSDLSWSTAILSHSDKATHRVRAAQNRSELVLAVRNVLPSAQSMDTDLKRTAYTTALHAFATWGEWSDEWEELLEDLDTTDDPFSASWYLALLTLKGVDTATIERERDAIRDGLAVRVTDRFRHTTNNA